MSQQTYRQEIASRIPADDLYQDVYPLCTSKLEVQLYKLCRAPGVYTVSERGASLPWRIKGLQAQLDLMAEPTRELYRLLTSFHGTARAIESAAPNLQSAEQYEATMDNLAELADDSFFWVARLEDCALYAITAGRDPLAAESWARHHSDQPLAYVMETAVSKLDSVLQGLDFLLELTLDMVRNPERYQTNDDEVEVSWL